MMQPSFLRRTLAVYAGTPWYYQLLLVGLIFLFDEIWQAGPRDLSKVAGLIQQAHAAGGIARTHDYAQYWLTVVARAGVFITLGALLISPWLVRGASRPSGEGVAQFKANRWLWIVAAVVTLASAAANAPRLRHSFWFDEECTARRFIVGEFSAEGALKTPKWERTLFYYNDPNNHPLCSVLGRVSHGLGKTPTGPNEFPFQEWAIRLPMFLFGLGGLLALAWLAAVAGQPKAGMIAVLLLALHPWYVRYSVETRGYALLLALVPLSHGCLLRALQTGRLGWFLGFGLLEFLCLWSYPGVLYLLFLVNAAALGWIWLNRSDDMNFSMRWTLFGRLCAGNVVGALLSMLLLAPMVPPMLVYLRSDRMRGEITTSMVAETVSGLFTGQPWARWGDHENALALAQVWSHSPAPVGLMLAGLAAALGCGLVALWRTNGPFRWIGTAALATGPFMMMMARLQGNIVYPWYVIFTLPAVLLIMAMGLEWACRRIRLRSTALLIPLGAVGAFALFTWRQDSLLRRFPIEPMRESVVAMRPVVNPFSPEVQATLSGSLCYSLRLYDPFATPLETLADLKALMAEADSRHAPLVINFANLGFARLRFPDIMAVLEDGRVFKSDPPYNGLHAQPERWVFRYVGAR